jgi:hypothetical protein
VERLNGYEIRNSKETEKNQKAKCAVEPNLRFPALGIGHWALGAHGEEAKPNAQSHFDRAARNEAKRKVKHGTGAPSFTLCTQALTMLSGAPEFENS